jgi:tRNA threonylcarbamoyladenosine biosynthesis protein TsaE
MGTRIQLDKTTANSDETESLGRAVGGRLKGGEVIELTSDLGGGKTTLVRGLAAGAGSSDHVASPTFTLSKVYKSNRFEIHHFDFYRLQEPGIMRDELQELLQEPSTVVVVEWSDIVQSVLPEDRLIIRITRAATSEDARQVHFDFPEELSYLIKELQ